MKKQGKKKKKKKIYLLFLGIILILISTLFMPFSFVRKPNTKDQNYEYVVSNSLKNSNPFITDVAFLGAHDAFTSEITYKSINDPNEKGITENKVINSIAKGLVVRMSKAQNASAKEMLYSGVRYFDVRITLVDNIYYTMHGYLSSFLSVYLKDVVDFLGSHPGEVIIFDIQHFYTKDGSNRKLGESDYKNLFDYIATIKNDDGLSLMDYVHYNILGVQIPLSSLTYLGALGLLGRSNSGAVILAKTDAFASVYERDPDASYVLNEYKNVRSLWHNTNSTKKMFEGIETEYQYLMDHNVSGIFVVNQAQKTGLIMDISIIKSLFSWSLLDMANNFNAKLIKSEDDFKRWLRVMPIFMVDNVTSRKGDFVYYANKYISEFNQTL